MTKYGYIDIPNAFFEGTKMAASKLLARASVYSLSSSEREQFGYKKKQNRVKFTVSSFANRYNVSASTSRRALASLEECEKIDKTDDGMYFDADKMKEGKEKGYLHVEGWLFFVTFAGEYLTKSEVLVLARLLSLAKKGVKVKENYRYIAKGLGLSHTFVMNAVEKLKRLNIINMDPRAYKRCNTTIYINKGYLQEKKAEMQRTGRTGTLNDRQKYYTNLRNLAIERKNAMFQRACQDKIFSENYAKWFYKQTDKHLLAILIERLSSMNMTWGDITRLQHKCARCQDTGTLQDGSPCGCYDMNK